MLQGTCVGQNSMTLLHAAAAAKDTSHKVKRLLDLGFPVDALDLVSEARRMLLEVRYNWTTFHRRIAHLCFTLFVKQTWHLFTCFWKVVLILLLLTGYLGLAVRVKHVIIANDVD